MKKNRNTGPTMHEPTKKGSMPVKCSKIEQRPDQGQELTDSREEHVQIMKRYQEKLAELTLDLVTAKHDLETTQEQTKEFEYKAQEIKKLLNDLKCSYEEDEREDILLNRAKEPKKDNPGPGNPLKDFTQVYYLN
jgi:chromosome segregation ATPase